MNVKYNMVVDFARPTKTNTILVSERDNNSRLCHFVLMEDKQPFDMSDVVSVMLKGVASNGSNIFEDVTGNIILDEDGNKTNKIEYTLPDTITNYAGTSTITVTLRSALNETITSFEQYIKVRNTLFNEDDEATEEDIEGFSDLLNRVQDALSQLEENVKNDSLKNPYALRIQNLDGVSTIDYDGHELVTVSFGNIGYLSDDYTLVDSVDETAANQAVASANQARVSAETAQAGVNYVASSMNTAKDMADDVVAKAAAAQEIYNNIYSIIPTVSINRDNATGRVTITITDYQGEHTAYVYDGTGGGSVVGNYADLPDKPTINNVEIDGDMTLAELGIAAASHTHTTSQITDLVVPSISVSNKVNGQVTFTIVDGTGTHTATISDGAAGAAGAGNSWYRGTAISGKSATATIFEESGIVNALSGDNYINTSEGAIYHCVVGGAASAATWAYDFTMTGGGSGGGSGTSNYNDLDNIPYVNSVKLTGNKSSDDLSLASKVHTHAHTDITDWDTELNKKANSATTYSKTEVDGLVSAKADASTTLSGYGITNAYTKSEMDTKLAEKITSPTNPSVGVVLTHQGGGVWTGVAGLTENNLKKTPAAIQSASNDNSVPSAYGLKNFANRYTKRIKMVVPANKNVIGKWQECDPSEWELTSTKDGREYDNFVFHPAFYEADNETIEFTFLFDSACNQPIYLGGYKWISQTNRMIDSKPCGGLCIMLANAPDVDTTIYVDVTHVYVEEDEVDLSE